MLSKILPARFSSYILLISLWDGPLVDFHSWWTGFICFDKSSQECFPKACFKTAIMDLIKINKVIE